MYHNQIELDAVGKAQRKVIGEFKERLAHIIEKNETLPELEKMERSEFVVDVAGRYLAAENRRKFLTRLALLTRNQSHAIIVGSQTSGASFSP